MAAEPILWNSLPVSIRSACTNSDFKQKRKTFLFSKAFFIVSTISLYLDIYIVFLHITFLITNCKYCSFRL